MANIEVPPPNPICKMSMQHENQNKFSMSDKGKNTESDSNGNQFIIKYGLTTLEFESKVLEINSLLKTLGGGGRPIQALKGLQNTLTGTHYFSSEQSIDPVTVSQLFATTQDKIQELRISLKNLNFENEVLERSLTDFIICIQEVMTKSNIKHEYTPYNYSIEDLFGSFHTSLEKLTMVLHTLEKDINSRKQNEEHLDRQYCSHITTAAFVSGASIVMLQAVYNGANSTLDDVAIFAWIHSLLLGILTTTTSLGIIYWHTSLARQYDDPSLLPKFATIVIQNGSGFTLFVSLIIFVIGFGAYIFKIAFSQKKILFAASPLVFTSVYFIVILCIISMISRRNVKKFYKTIFSARRH